MKEVNVMIVMISVKACNSKSHRSELAVLATFQHSYPDLPQS